MPRPVAWPWPTRRCRWPTWGRPGGGRQGETWACAWCSRPSGARPPREARGRRRGGAAGRAESRRSVVQMTQGLAPAATPATVLGPFHIAGSPELGFGADMSEGLPGTPLYLHGRVTDLDGKPVAGAVLDVWQADTEGLYESQVADV